jgi:hypothetical protein
MSEERVDKKWVDDGLEKYSTQAILGTLAHYGVTIDEPAFKALAQTKYPMTIAQTWAAAWKGTGKFQSFPPVAAGQLWSRWLGAELTPETIGISLIGAIRAVAEDDEAIAQKAFGVLDTHLPKLPTGVRRAAFMSELEPWFQAMQLSLEGLIDELVGKGKKEHAAKFVAISDALYPERKELAKAVLERDAATLVALAKDAQRAPMVRLAAVDALVPLGKASEMFPVVAEVQQKAVADENVAVVRALHSTTHLIGQHLSPSDMQQARVLVDQQHDALQRLTGHSAHG